MHKALLAGLSLSATAFILLTACTQTPVKPAPFSFASGIDLTAIDKSVRPQDDFFHYVNGDYLKRTSIPADRTSIGAFYDLREAARENIKTIIDELAAKPDLKPGSDEQKVADLYRSYMDTAALESLGTAPLQADMAAIDAIGDKHALLDYFARAQAQGINTPLHFYVDIDDKDSTRYAAHIWQGGLGLPERDYYFKDDTRHKTLRAQYQTHIATMFTLAGLSDAQASAQRIMALETRLAAQHWTNVENRDSTKRYNKYALARLTTLAAIDWPGYLKALGAGAEQDIIINQPSFIKGLGKELADTSLEDWKLFLKWKRLNSAADYLNKALEEANFAFYGKTLNGQQEQEARWKRGTDLVNGSLGQVVGKVYVKRYFTPKAKARMLQLVENLRTAYGQSIDELSWMGEQTKQQAHIKLAKFTPKIGYPDKWDDYSKLTINAHDLYGNMQRVTRFHFQEDLDKLGGPIRTWEWHMHPQTVNAYYNPAMNEIVFPAAILQPPFFNMATDDAANYGGIGAVIGHEMGHGFDDQGAKYDGDGNMRNWWTAQDEKNFQQRAHALIEQYANFKVFDDLHVNGELTLGENIGDLSGLSIAYKAYKLSLKGKPAPVIDGLTGDQRFFMGFAQIWRSKFKEETARNRVATDPHSPAMFRANGPLSNFTPFYQAFAVKPGDAMYREPQQRVKIW